MMNLILLLIYTLTCLTTNYNYVYKLKPFAETTRSGGHTITNNLKKRLLKK